MTWVVVPFPAGDPLRVHVVPVAPRGEDPDPMHEPSLDCPCGTRLRRETSDIDLVTREIVVHTGPN